MVAEVENVEVTGETILRPSSPHPLSNTQVLVNIFDRVHSNGHINILYAFRAPTPDNDDLKLGLSKTLFYYPQHAGRIIPDESGDLRILLNDAGIRVVETQVKATLEEHLPLVPSGELSKLYAPSKGVEELLLVQLNRFSCGGLVVATTMHHYVNDGIGGSLFLHAWAKLVRGLTLDRLPYLDRDAVAAPRNPPKCEFNHHAIEFRAKNPTSLSSDAAPTKTCSLVVHFSKGFIGKLKAKVSTGDHQRVSTFRCLLTHLWKKVTLARGLKDEEVTEVRLAVNGRRKMTPPVPAEFFGNLVLWAYPRMTVKELLNGSYSYVADVIQESVAKVDDAYFRSFIDFGALAKKERGNLAELVAATPEVTDVLCPNLEVASWLDLQLHELDVGYGKPCAFLRPDVCVEGLLILVPSCDKEGGVDVSMSLLPEHAASFELISHSLD